MALASGIAKSVVYKKETTFGTLATASGAQTVRRVSADFNLAKETYQSDEIRTDYQIADFRHGVRTTEGSISGELSSGTYSDFIASAVAKPFVAVTPSALGSTTIAAGTGATLGMYTITRTTGSWLTDGAKAGLVIRLVGFNANNVGKNLLIVQAEALKLTVITLNGTTLTTETVASAATYTSGGKVTYAPNTGHTDDSYTIEQWYSDIKQSEVYVGNKVNTASFALPATGLVTADFGFVGQDLQRTGITQYFTTPTVQSQTGIFAAVNGALLVDGKVVSLVTGLNININRNMSSEAVVGSNIKPEIYEGRISVDGDFSTLFQDRTFSDVFNNESEIAIICAVTESNANDAGFMTFTLPRIKLSTDTKDDGEKGLVAQNSFQALKGTGAGGFEATTIQIQDSGAV